MVAENTGDYSTAARMLASVPKQVRQQPESIVALARSYYHLGQQENARRTLDELSNHPSGPQAVFLGAQIADEMHDYDTAEKLLTSIQQTFPDASHLTYTKALIQYHNEQFSQCEQTLQQEIDAGGARERFAICWPGVIKNRIRLPTLGVRWKKAFALNLRTRRTTPT